MNSVVPTTGPASPTPSSGQTATAARAVGALVNAPPALAHQATGTVLTGIVTQIASPELVLIKTSHGVLELATRLALAVGNKVTLQIQSAGARMQVIILAVDDKAVAGNRPSGGTKAGSTAPTASGAAHPAPLASPSPGGPSANPGLAAASASGAPQAPTPPALAPGSTLAASITPSTPPAGGTETAAQQLIVRIVSLETVARPTPGSTLMARHSKGDVTSMSATAAGADADGRPVLKTPLGMMTLHTRAPLPAGAVLLVELLGREPPVPAGAHLAPAERHTILASLVGGWTALDEAVQELGHHDPAVARALVDTGLPKPGPRLLPDLLGYVAGLRGATLSAWPGAAIAQALERAGKPELAARLRDDFGQMGRLATDAGPGDWRLFLIPFYHEQRISQIHLFLHRQRHQRQRGDDDAGTRFVVEVETGALGSLQLDGLAHGKRLDMILRTHAALPAPMRQDITALFTHSCEAYGMAGEIAFQAVAVFPVTPLDDIAARAPGLTA